MFLVFTIFDTLLVHTFVFLACSAHLTDVTREESPCNSFLIKSSHTHDKKSLDSGTTSSLKIHYALYHLLDWLGSLMHRIASQSNANIKNLTFSQFNRIFNQLSLSLLV